MKINHTIEKLSSILQNHLQSNLAGIYLHGSLAMNCFNPIHSDIDLLVICKSKLTDDSLKRRLIDNMMAFSNIHYPNPIEMSVILGEYAGNFVYPTPFELHYSDYHKEKYTADNQYLVHNDTDTDLAAHLYTTYYRGKTIYGQPIKEIINSVPKHYYLDSIVQDIKNAKNEIIKNPVYYCLNLCRVLRFLRDKAVTSKKEGGEWGLKHLDRKYADIISACLSQYSGRSYNDKLDINPEVLTSFAEYMLHEIKQELGNSYRLL
ncbi:MULTISPECIES: aminoglycoside adenylyltransferase domain-containing protein [Bacillus]|uniref:Spectinomycin 9-adenylyltransferase n=2 Tax=Bacillus TaxID=1386 RepID=A0A0M3R8Z4_9BACI|nr:MULTISPECIES: aminoglycoside adenylyltransferase domain-containing protein [Bacillus]ALC80542.1 hypothetical protein AM592_02295 [Bacillus gobiensis]MBP1083620.1 streptomycin 3'-adenylyltransferase [Bacillus capparidis]MED1094813.1 DUF4111 domain-containing protein [Bacillus capparidis]